MSINNLLFHLRPTLGISSESGSYMIHLRKFSVISTVILLALWTFVLTSQAASLEKVLYSFPNPGDGTAPNGDDPGGGLITINGIFYGVTVIGGDNNLGAIYSLIPAGNGHGAIETILYSFKGGDDGVQPGSPLVAGPNGVLYGTTEFGGGTDNTGVVFSLTPPAIAGGAWTENIVHTISFTEHAVLGLTRGPNNSLFAVADGGQFGFGSVFRLSPPASGSGPWTKTEIYSFQGRTDGQGPNSLLRAPDGTLCGTTGGGGAPSMFFCGGPTLGCGTVFSLTPPSSTGGTWTHTVLYSFGQNDTFTSDAHGSNAIIRAADGTLYGSSGAGGLGGVGVVYSVSPPTVSGGDWTENILYTFRPHALGCGTGQPVTLLNGNLYGIAGCGAKGDALVFALTPPAVAGDPWIFTDIHDFNPSSSALEGYNPSSPLLQNGGKLYGETIHTAGTGHTTDFGTVYSPAVVPNVRVGVATAASPHHEAAVDNQLGAGHVIRCA